ncbi:MAG: hypothetical protein D5R96_05980 [Methanocalculus sp. MSAO_Arc2]|nr:MAG: hypothetical protein D5R96_05980 [Methanocalculus sp. MSAO_Arc2]
MLSGFIAIIIFSLLLLTAVILLPWYLNIYHGYKIRNRILDNIENNHTFFADCIKEDREKIITQLLAPPEKKGTTRFTMMAGVTFIIATVILYILIAHGPENSTILQSALGVLTGAFAAIIGFYFGGRVYPPEELTKEKLKELAQEMREDGKKLSQPETIKNSESENTEKQQSNNEKID